MRFKKVLLIQAKYDRTFSNVLPYGLGILSEVLTKNGISNAVFDLNKDDSFERLTRKIFSFKPDLIGLSLMTLNYKYNFEIMRKVRKVWKDAKIIAGGPHISTLRAEVLRDIKVIDYGAVLEGEKTLLELCRGEEVNNIKGLLYRMPSGSVIYTGDREFITDLDEIPFPKYGKFSKSIYSGLITIITSRGCPYTCIYCPVNLAVGRMLRFRSAENVVREIEYHYKLGYREFSFRDDNFTLDKNHVYKICDSIEKRGLKDLYLMCDNGIRADKVDTELLRRMREVGFRMLGFGIESGSQKVLNNIKKNEKVEEMKQAVGIACELGYEVELFFLIGSPGETWDDFLESVKFATEFPVSIVSFYQLLPYPATELFDYVSKNGRFAAAPEVYLNNGSQRKNTPFFETPELSFKERKKAFRFALNAVRNSPVITSARKRRRKNNIAGKLTSFGIEGRARDVVCAIYCNNFLHERVFTSRLAARLKKAIERRGLRIKEL
ncbi:MAG: B12-binding domain-containing radical SAM protein [Omnitrophica bacterium]|nr:B12-binding domain-containing radical SAM protein [Candidatus Omnitrophota bacterium]